MLNDILNIPLISILSLIGGVLFKLYDDLVDLEKIDPQSPHLEIVKVLLVVIVSIVLTQDFTFSIGMLAYSILVFALGSTDTPFWKACLIIPFITTILSYNTYQYKGLVDIFQRCILIGGFLVGAGAEWLIFTEETSEAKTFSRLVSIIAYIFINLLTSSWSAHDTISNVSMWLIGYSGCHIVFHQFIHPYILSGKMATAAVLAPASAPSQDKEIHIHN
jgi:hypothetical protein